MFNYLVYAVLTLANWAVASPLLETRQAGISQSLYNDLVRYTQYSSASYQLVCPFPLGNTLVQGFSISSTNGFVARDDDRGEIVVAFQGTFNLQDFLTDVDIILTPLEAPGITQTGGAYVHSGFLDAFNVAANDVLQVVRSQLADYPKYNLVITGHSLGGALAALGALSLRGTFPKAPLKLYTFGQPRTGDPAFAALLEQQIGVNNIFRAVHTYDGVPTMIPQVLGYQHSAVEYWNFQEPPSPANTKKCSGEEDPTCSDSIPSTGINLAHITYFGQHIALDPTLCL